MIHRLLGFSKSKKKDKSAKEQKTPIVKSDGGVSDDSSINEKKRVKDLGLKGISVGYLAKKLLKDVVKAGLKKSSTIKELENLEDFDHDGFIRKKGASKICPEDGKIGAAYVHSILEPKAVGRAQIMLSYSWGYTIGDIVDTLQVYCHNSGKNPDHVYVWICCFCINQHRVIAMRRQKKDVPFDEFRSIFEQRVTEIGHIVAMMAPWQEPFYLTRIWCIFEMFTAKNNGSTISITMPSAEKERFIKGLTSEDGINQLDVLFTALAKVEVTNAKAWAEEDRTKILKIVEEEVGYAEFNIAVSGLLREWAIGVVIAAVEEGRDQVEDDRSKKRHGELLNTVRKLLIEIAVHGARVLSMAKEALILNEEIHGHENVHTAQSILLVGVGLGMTGNLDEALTTLKEALEVYEIIHSGRENEDVAEVLLKIGGILYYGMGDEEGALNVYSESLSTRELLFGEDSIKTTTARSNVAEMLGKKGEVDESLRLNELNLTIQMKCPGLGKYHPDTANSMNNIGIAYAIKGEYDKALELFKSALVIAEKVFGSDDYDTKDYRRNVADAEREIKNKQS